MPGEVVGVGRGRRPARSWRPRRRTARRASRGRRSPRGARRPPGVRAPERRRSASGRRRWRTPPGRGRRPGGSARRRGRRDRPAARGAPPRRRRGRGRRPGRRRGEQRLGDAVVQEPAPGERRLVVHELAHLAVGEVVGGLVRRGPLLHEPARHQLVETGHRLVVAAAAGRPDDVEGERPPDHRRRREHLRGPVGQRRQAAAQQVTDVGGRGLPAGQRIEVGDHEERQTLALPDDLVGRPARRRRPAPPRRPAPRRTSGDSRPSRMADAARRRGAGRRARGRAVRSRRPRRCAG